MLEAIYTITISLSTAIIVAVVNHFLTTKEKRNERQRELKLKAYSSFLDNARAFLDDPNLSKDDIRKSKKQFLEKYYNEIILFADSSIQLKIESFVNTGGVASTNPGNQVTKFKDMIIAIRKDLDFSEDEVLKDFKFYTLDIEKR